MVPSEVTILVVHGEADLRSLVRSAVGGIKQFEIVGETGDGADAIAWASRLQPDIVVLDLGLPDLTGLRVLGEIVRVSPASRVVVLSGLDKGGARTAALAGDASGYELQWADSTVLLRAMDIERRAGDVDLIQLGADKRSVAAGRRFVTEFCLSRGCDVLVDGAVLVASELVTNAVVYAQTECVLEATLEGRFLRVAVSDTSPVAPSPRLASAASHGGRGLFIVAAVASVWGVVPTPEGKTVWAELALAGGGLSTK